MSEQDGVNTETATPAGTPPAEQTEVQPPATASDGDTSSDGTGTSDEHLIPKHRLDEEIAKRRELETELSNYQSTTSKKFDALSEALSGKSGKDVDGAVEKLSKQYGVDEKFISDMLDEAEGRAVKRLEKNLQPLKSQQAQVVFQNELNELYKEHPDAADMSTDELKAFRKTAVDKKYLNTPLVDIWKIQTYGKPSGKKKTIESSRGGTSTFDDGEVDIASMGVLEFEKWSNNLAKK